MNIVLLGAPGAGKGTQASMLCEKMNIPHISTGDIFRHHIKELTPIGIVAKGYIDKGELVPDSVTEEIVKIRLSEPDCADGYILDGFPRTVAQAEALAGFSKVDAVIDIDIPLNKLLKRLTGRRVCSSCGESYHVDYLGSNRTCGKCGGHLVHRADDAEETVKERLDVYVHKTAPLIDFYEKAGVIKRVNGDLPIDLVLEEIQEALK
jgi:adenylate kinase